MGTSQLQASEPTRPRANFISTTARARRLRALDYLGGLAVMLACLALGLLTTASKPTIIQIIGDDCGYNDFGYQNGGLTLTPEIDALVASGLRLDTVRTERPVKTGRGRGHWEGGTGREGYFFFFFSLTAAPLYHGCSKMRTWQCAGGGDG